MDQSSRFLVLLFITSSFGFLFSGLSFMTEGWTYFFILFDLKLFLDKKWFGFTLTLIISIFQRETTALFFISFSFLTLFSDYMLTKTINLRKTSYFLSVLAVVIFYVVLRKLIFLSPTGVNSNQLDYQNLLSNITHPKINIEWLRQFGFSLGLMGILPILDYKYNKNKIHNDPLSEHKICFILSLLFLIFVGIATDIGPNIGRIVSSFTSFWLIMYFPVVKRALSY
jgi:hypothetical protein